jgi:chemotaxis protein CheC
MESNINLTEDERDCLQELMNIAYGSATAAITEILDTFANLSIPRIEIIDSNELKNYIFDNLDLELEHLVSIQQINGTISGENMFIIDKQSAINIAYKFGLEDNEINDNEISDIVLEITNILSSSTISKLAEDMHTNVCFSAPIIKNLTSMNQLNNLLVSKFEKVIIISTELKFEELNIKAKLFILTTDNSILFIKEKIKKILDEL